MIPIHKHFKETLDRYRYSSEYEDIGVDVWFDHKEYDLRLTNELPLTSTNVSLDSSLYLTEGSSVKYTDGYTQLGAIDFGNYVSLSIFIYSNSTIPIFSIASNFHILYNLGNLTITRKLSTGIYEDVTVPLTIAENEWVHFLLIREFNTVKIYLNLELVSSFVFNYEVESGTGYIGRNLYSNVSYTGNFSLFKYYSINIDPKYINIEGLLRETAAVDNISGYNLVQYLMRQDLVSYSTLKTNTTTTYSSALSAWVVTPNGLVIEGDNLDKTTYPLTLEFELEGPANPTSNFVLISHWFLASFISFYIRYNFLTNNLEIVYLDNTIQTEILSPYKTGKNTYCIQFTYNDLEVFINGSSVFNKTSAGILPYTYKFAFNSNVNGILNTSNNVNLYWFASYNLKKYNSNYLPVKPLENNYSRKPSLLKLNNHAVEYANAWYPTITNKFTVLGSTTLTPGVAQTITITQLNTQRHFASYTVSFIPDSEVVQSDLTFPLLFSISPVATTATFDVLFVTNDNPYKNKFKLKISNGYHTEIIEFIVDYGSFTFNKSFITSNSAYLDGYLAIDSSTPGILPNLTNTLTATTTSSKINSIYGPSYLLEDINDEIVLSSSLENVRSVVLLYKELELVENRSYVGDSLEYTFNGGSTGELVAPLLLNSGDFTKTFEISSDTFKTCLNQSNTVLVSIDTVVNKVLVYQKVAGVWSTIPTELTLDLQTPNVTTNASVSISDDGTYIVLGFPEANLGEGVVQLWHLSSGIWTKELHLGSPVPSPYTGGFGYQVDISNTGETLFVTQIGDSSVYIFEKDITWSTTPDEVIIGADRFGYSLSCSGDGLRFIATAIDSNTSYIYSKTTNWTLEETISFGIISKLSRIGNLVAISDYVLKEVRLYRNLAGWTLEKTLTSSSTNYGYAMSLSNTDDLAVSSINQGLVFVYTASSNYVDFSTFEGDVNYGYSICLNENSLVISDYSSVLELYTNESAALPQKIIFARQRFNNSALSSNLLKDDINILTFSSNVALQIDRVGNSKIGTGLNGYFLGVLFFNQVLDVSYIEQLEDFLTKYLKLDRYSLYD